VAGGPFFVSRMRGHSARYAQLDLPGTTGRMAGGALPAFDFEGALKSGETAVLNQLLVVNSLTKIHTAQ
jgi:hypothetical protein